MVERCGITAMNGPLLDFFLTAPVACGYLPDRESTSVVADPACAIGSELYGVLLDHGFRRSGRVVYRPRCARCHACVSVRVPVARFSPSRSQRRVWRANQAVTVVMRQPRFHEAHYRLFRRYQHDQHGDTMAAGQDDDDPRTAYMRFLVQSTVDTVFHEYWIGERLAGVGVVDRLPQGLSTVYFFYDPEARRRSLGTYSVLWEIAEARRLDLPYYYLGYWIRESPKMDYKARFQPLEYWVDGRWQEQAPG